MEYIICGAHMTDKKEAHEEIMRAMEFPEYYGCNLDALYDMLTSTMGRAVLTETAAMLNALGAYGCELLKTFFDAADENPEFEFIAE